MQPLDSLREIEVEIRGVGGGFCRDPLAIAGLLAAGGAGVTVVPAFELREVVEPSCKAGRVHDGGELLPVRAECAHREGRETSRGRAGEGLDLRPEPNRAVPVVQEQVRVLEHAAVARVLDYELRADGHACCNNGSHTCDHEVRVS